MNASDEKSGVNREIHAPFCGEPGGENPPGDRLNKTKDNDSAQDKDLSDTERTELDGSEGELHTEAVTALVVACLTTAL